MPESYIEIFFRIIVDLFQYDPQHVYMVKGSLGTVLNFTIIVVDGKPITIGKILIGFMFLVWGLIFSRFIIATVSKRLIQPFVDNRSASHAIENISFYLLAAFFCLVALQVANIPITIFGYIGTALAVAAGLGSQNIMNNFISGIILMIERPVKIGDFVYVENVFGRVEDIGARATTINSIGNKHLIIPNSKLLETRVDNWTHNSKRVKAELKVGVVYGTDPQVVEKLLVEAAKEDPRVLKFADPFVIFDDFGDNSLIFKLYFDVKVKDLFDDQLSLSSLRFRINAKFREQGIVIAFPQRDLHLYTKDPIKVDLGKVS